MKRPVAARIAFGAGDDEDGGGGWREGHAVLNEGGSADMEIVYAARMKLRTSISPISYENLLGIIFITLTQPLYVTNKCFLRVSKLIR